MTSIILTPKPTTSSRPLVSSLRLSGYKSKPHSPVIVKQSPVPNPSKSPDHHHESSNGKLEKVISFLITADLGATLYPDVDIHLIGSPEPAPVLIRIHIDRKYEYLDEKFHRSLQRISYSCVDFVRDLRSCMSSTPDSNTSPQSILETFTHNILFPSLIPLHSSALFNVLPQLLSQLQQSRNIISSLPPLKIRPLIFRILKELRVASDEKSTQEERCDALAIAMFKCVELLEDRNDSGISIVEASWGRKHSTLAQSKTVDTELRALLHFPTRSEQILLSHTIDTFFSDSLKKNRNVPQPFQGERPMYPITRVAIKLGRFAQATRLVSEALVSVPYHGDTKFKISIV